MRAPGSYVNRLTPSSGESSALRAKRHCMPASGGLRSSRSWKFVLVQPGMRAAFRASTGLRREVHRVRDLEALDRRSAGQVASLVADVHEDLDLALPLEALAGRGLVGGGRLAELVVRPHDQRVL